MYYIYQLKFTAPVHFGRAEQGGKLERVSLGYSSDTLFSALCHELSTDLTRLNKFISDAKDKKILLSDLMPYNVVGGDNYFFIPKPLIQPPSAEKKKSLAAKKLKGIDYIRASRIAEYITDLKNNIDFIAAENEYNFGEFSLMTRINVRQEIPYSVGLFAFNPDAGLYGIVYLADDNIDEFMELIEYLGLSGIGGKRSSGYGKFELYDDAYPLEDSFSADDMAINKRINIKNAAYYLALSNVLPNENTLIALKHSFYKLQKRSGFIGGSSQMQKKNSVYMVKAGSCLNARIAGELISLGECDNHEILRYGRGIYLGVET